MKIAELDKNLAVEKRINEDIRKNLAFFDAEEKPFSIHGVFRDGESFARVPEKIAETVSEGVHSLSRCTAGGRVRFRTNSRHVAVLAACPENEGMPHFAYTGVCGFDVYADFRDSQRYFGTIVPPLGFQGGFEGVVTFPDETMRTVTVNMPLYNGVNKLYIGIDEGSVIEEAAPYAELPVVYYGSSITQGGCASRPGCTYQAIIHSTWNTDHINLGFSGNARAEQEMMDYIASLEMSAFVYDYDYNAFSNEHYAATHYNGYRTVREKHPDIPIIMMTRPRRHPDNETMNRIRTMLNTYEKARAEGDENIYYITGLTLVGGRFTGEYCLVDDCHPTDLGFLMMAKRLMLVLNEALTESRRKKIGATVEDILNENLEAFLELAK